MSRTAYHRAYYYANVERRRASARAARRKAREWLAVIRIVCEAVTDARNDKPPLGGLTRQAGCLYARVAVRRSSSLARLIPLSTYLYASAFLDGETTRRKSLNLHRGSQPVGARRQSGSANGTQGDES